MIDGSVRPIYIETAHCKMYEWEWEWERLRAEQRRARQPIFIVVIVFVVIVFVVIIFLVITSHEPPTPIVYRHMPYIHALLSSRNGAGSRKQENIDRTSLIYFASSGDYPFLLLRCPRFASPSFEPLDYRQGHAGPSIKLTSKSRHMAYQVQNDFPKYKSERSVHLHASVGQGGTRLGQGRRGVIVMFEALQGRLDVSAVTCRSDDDGQAEDVHVDDGYGVQHKDGRKRELQGNRNQPLATVIEKRGT
jgi:hypothetical protein